MVIDADLQRRIITVRMTQILGDEIRARMWMHTLQAEFAGPVYRWLADRE